MESAGRRQHGREGDPIKTNEQEDAQLQVYFSKTATPAAKAKARDILICSNLRYVFKRAKKYSRGNVEQFEDLIAAGALALNLYFA